MAYKKNKMEKIFNSICIKIEKGKPLRQILKEKNMPSTQTFYKWLEESEDKSKRYARACETRSDILFEEILEIADKQDQDITITAEGNEITNHNVINRSRLMVDARKWILSKMNPKKYGDKLEVDQKQKQIIQFENISKQFPDK